MKLIIKFLKYLLLILLPAISCFSIYKYYYLFDRYKNAKELLSIYSNIITLFAFIYTLYFFISDKLTIRNSHKSRKNALQMELKYNQNIQSRLNMMNNEKTIPFDRYELSIIEQILLLGEYDRRKIDSLWNLFISMKKTNKILDKMAALPLTRNQSYTDYSQNRNYNEEVSFQLKCLGEELIVTNDLLKKNLI